MTEYTLDAAGYPYRIREEGSGFPVIWLHGMFHSLEVEEQFAVVDFSRLAARFRLIRIELPAHGKSPVAAGAARLTWPSLAGDLINLAEQLQLERFFIGGFSQGAAIATHVALQMPDRVAGLMLAMLPKIWDSRPEVRKTYSKVLGRLHDGNYRQVLSRLFALNKYPPDFCVEEPTGMQQAIIQKMLDRPCEAFCQILEGAVESDFPGRAEVACLPLPAFMLAWENDANHPIESSLEVRAALSRAELTVLTEKEAFLNASGRLEAFIFNNL